MKINKKVINLLLYAVALAMGGASTVLPILGEPQKTSTILLGIGILCLSIAGLQSTKKK